MNGDSYSYLKPTRNARVYLPNSLRSTQLTREREEGRGLDLGHRVITVDAELPDGLTVHVVPHVEALPVRIVKDWAEDTSGVAFYSGRGCLYVGVISLKRTKMQKKC